MCSVFITLAAFGCILFRDGEERTHTPKNHTAVFANWLVLIIILFILFFAGLFKIPLLINRGGSNRLHVIITVIILWHLVLYSLNTEG